MTTVSATVQPTEPPRVTVTVQSVVTPTRALLFNGSFETPDMAGSTSAYVPNGGWVNGLAAGADVAPYTIRQGPNANVSIAPALGYRYFVSDFSSSTKQRATVYNQTRPATEGERIKADAKVMASNVSGAGTGYFALQLIPLKGTVSGSVNGIATLDGPTWGTWQALHAEVTMPPGFDNVMVSLYYSANPYAGASQLLIDAVAASAYEPAISTVSLMREVDGVRSPVRGAQNIAAPGSDLVITDHEAPFGKSVTYVFVKSYTDGTTGETVSAPVVLTTARPWISHPITGVGVTATITEWSELAYAARRNVIAVAGRSRPIAISDRRLAPTSQVTMLTKTRSDLLALRTLLGLGDVLLVRPVCDAVEGDYLSIGDVTEARVKPTGDGAGSDWRRLVSMDAQAVDIPDTSIPAVGDTLADLNAYVPTTLADIATAFGANATLLTIAQTNVRAG